MPSPPVEFGRCDESSDDGRLKRGCGCAVVPATAAFSTAGSSLPEVGPAAPPLDLKASDGMRHSVDAGDGPKVLIFFRGLWRPFRRCQLFELRRNLAVLEAIGAEVWTISPDSEQRLAKSAAANGIDFTLLTDPDLQVISNWGLVNPDNPNVPHRAAVIVDSEGVVRYVRQDVDHTKRQSTEELVAAAVDIER